MEKVTLSFEKTFADSISIGVKNSASILGCILLWILTIWIPYINMGTTVAIVSLPVELSKGKIISPLSIFDSVYRKRFGEIFLLYGLMIIPILLGLLFFLIPGIVLSYTWMLAVYFVIDRGMNPMQALTASNEATFGSKFIVFGVTLVISIIMFVASGLIMMIFRYINIEFLTVLVSLILFVILFSISIAINASVYKQLKDNV